MLEMRRKHAKDIFRRTFNRPEIEVQVEEWLDFVDWLSVLRSERWAGGLPNIYRGETF